MKKVIKLSLVVFFMFGFLFSSLGQNPANAAGWLTPEWYAKYYGQNTTNPQPTPTPTPEPEPTPAPNPEPTPAPTTGGNYWSDPYYYYNKYNNNVKPNPTPNPTPNPIPNPAPTSQPEQGDAGMSSQEKQLAELINKERFSRGLQPLIFDAELTKWARIKTNDMITNNYFAHQSPTYGKVSDMLKNGGVSFKYAGENLGKTSSVTAAHSGFMNSSVHRAAILNSGYTHVGIGIQYKGSTMYVTEIFAAK